MLHLFFSSSYSFTGYAAHPHLHSFPTRRSSDLYQISHLRHLRLAAARRRSRADEHRPVERVWIGASRSEEHTSELQSQFHLVCRLLLEKKNVASQSRSRCAAQLHRLA